MNITKSLTKARTKLSSISTSHLSKEDTITELNKVLNLILDIISYINSAQQQATEEPKDSNFLEVYEKIFGEDQRIEDEIKTLRDLIFSTIKSLSKTPSNQNPESPSITLKQTPSIQELSSNINQEAINKIVENFDEVFVSKEKILKVINFKVKTSSLNTEIKELETTKPFEIQQRGRKVFILINSKNIKFQAVQASELALSIHFTECIFKAICKHHFGLDEEETEDRIDLFFDNHFKKLSLIK